MTPPQHKQRASAEWQEKDAEFDRDQQELLKET